MNLLYVGAFLGFSAAVCSAGNAPVEPIHLVSLDEAHRGDLNMDTRLLDSFGRLPEARRSFYLSARQILAHSPAATPADPRIVEAAKDAGLPLISGPMLGDVTQSGVTVWFRPVTAEVLTVHVSDTNGNTKKGMGVGITQPGASARIRLTNLDANTYYNYWVKDSAGEVLGAGSFKTSPKPESQGIYRIAFGSDFHKVGVHNPNLMRLIEKRGNHAMLLIGDSAVDDRETKTNLHYSDYLLRDMSKAWRTFSANVPVYASWDDHDYLNNDKSGLQQGQIDDEERNALRALWQENWVNPQTIVEDRGIYFNTVIGDVEIIMLDTRSCRDWGIKGQQGSYLGEAQTQWLFNTLKASKARFIILSSGTMWNDYLSHGKDSWGVWDIPGREEIFDFIEANEIGGVMLISGDRHGARGFTIERPSGFTLHEFEAGTLGGVPGPPPFASDRSTQSFGHASDVKAFGEFTFDMSKPDPEVTFRLINENEQELEKLSFSCSELTPGK
ncbi:alkaline phosphatase D family protein [Coraliomargarita sp. W4R53]